MANKRLEAIAKKFLLYFFGGLTLMVILVVAFSDDAPPKDKDSTDAPSKEKSTNIEVPKIIDNSVTAAPAEQESTDYTPCDCADISYKVAKNGGVDAASLSDNAKLEDCNELMASPSFSSKVNECPAYLKLMNLYKF